MARLPLSALLIALVLSTAACNRRAEDNPRRSITVKLPPAHAHESTPGFHEIANGENSLHSI